MCFCESETGEDNSRCRLAKVLLLIIVLAFLLSLRIDIPVAKSGKVDSIQSYNIISFYTSEAYNFAVKGFYKAKETLNYVTCSLFGVNCKSKLEETSSNESGAKKAVIDVNLQPKKDRFAMFKPNFSKRNKKKEPPKIDSCNKCTDKGEVCPEACLKLKKK